MTVREYSLKFLRLLRYATSLVSNNRDEMSRLLKGITKDLEEECRSAMIHDNLELFRLMVHVQQVEDSWKKMGARRPKTHDQADPSNGSNKNNFAVREHP